MALNLKVFIRLLTLTLLVILHVSIVYAERPIKVAVNFPLTGDLAVYGEALRDGMLLANKQLAPNYPKLSLAFDWQDNQSNNTVTNSVLKSHLKNKFDLYVSGLKPQTMVISDQISALGIPHLTWILDPKINFQHQNNLRVWINFNAETAVFIDYLKKQKDLQKVAMIYVDLPSAEVQYRQNIAKYLKERNVTDVLIENYPIDNLDFKTLALKLKKFNPQLLLVNGFAHHLIPLVRNLRTYQLVKDGNTLVSLDLLEAAPLLRNDELEGLVVAAPNFLLDNSANYQKWVKDFKNEFNKAPIYHAAFAYDSIKVILEAGNQLPEIFNQKTFLDALRKVNTKGVTGDLSFDQDASLINKMLPAIYRKGELKGFNDN